MGIGLDISDAESAWMEGADFEEWKAEFESEWNKPQSEMKIILMWEKMTPAMHDYYKKNTPEAYADIKQLVEDMKARNGGSNAHN
jgi:hypothetical protein